MGRDEVDPAVVALVAAHDRIAAAMFAVDGHPAAATLRDPDLTGATGRYAAELTADIAVLWSRFNALTAHLHRVRAVRARRGRPGDDELMELTVLLRLPIVPIGPDGAVPDGVAAPAVPRLTLTELARQLEGGCADVVGRLTRLDNAIAALAARFGPPTEALARLRAAAGELGADAVPADRLDRLDERLTTAYRGATADPIAVTPGAVAATALHTRLRGIAADIDALRAELDALTGLRDGYPRRAESLRAAVDAVDTAERSAATAGAAAREKIADPGLPEAPDAAGALRAHLAQLDQLYRERRWPRLAEELAAAERSVRAAAERAEYLRVAADGLLERRTELRGRLEAYRAKAARMGFAEHAELAARHRSAEELLYTRPCDLPAATRALAAYLRHLNQLSERGTR
ncbi:hypothetical protein [Micromonospora zhanjiangensis]|uniref:CHAD domain-containing protein n=1 Tax=Micromonospora zhanjiangensis TaxID=1522057 RepID=A0ABV8KV94_9ACTN